MNDIINDISHLLKLVDTYVLKRKEIESVYEGSGIRYNIFDVLKLSSSEVRLHSAILASLLNSTNHGAKNAFLKEFLSIPTLGLSERFLDSSKVKVEVEKYIGPKTKTRGGRIDILLSDGVQNLVIENKIYAYDQENQLLRYHNEYPDGILVYLTLDGAVPSKESLGSLSIDDVICLSYKDDIIPWLMKCTQLAANLPFVRETINQYINTLKILTNSHMTTNDEIIDIICQKENISAAFAIRDNLEAGVNKVMNAFISELKEALPHDSPFTCITEHQSDWLHQSCKGIQFEHSNWKYINFAVEFEGKYLNQMGVGFIKKPICNDIREIEGARELAVNRLGYTNSNSGWLWGYPNEPLVCSWFNSESILMLQDGRMVEWFMNTLKTVNDWSKDLVL